MSEPLYVETAVAALITNAERKMAPAKEERQDMVESGSTEDLMEQL